MVINTARFCVRKAWLPSEEKGVWLHFDMVPEQAEIREGAPDFTGKVCVIGAEGWTKRV